MKRFLFLLLSLAALSANAQLLWKISGKGLEKPSYIFGTYHAASLSIKDSIAALPQAISETQQVYGEVKMSDMFNPSPALIQHMQKCMTLPPDTTLQSLFTPEEYEALGKIVKEYMMADVSMLAQLRPSVISSQLVIMLCLKHTPGFNPQEQLDTYFQQTALQQGKKVEGLETVEWQMNLLYRGDDLKRQAEKLSCTVSHIDRTVEEIRQLVEAYYKQDLAALQRLFDLRYNDSCDPKPGEMEALIDNRNKAWAEKMPAIMQEAPTLFVVGAGHLVGKNGVLELLKQQGYTVEGER